MRVRIGVCAAALIVETGRVRVEHGMLWYKVVNADSSKPTLVVLHGGPQVPSDYLFELECLGRPVLFYDQLGCGRSDVGADHSVASSLRDLREVLTLVDRHHLFGHSWGGSLAFEHASRHDGALSLTLSSATTSIPLVEQEAGRLFEQAGSLEAFTQEHVCRVEFPGYEAALAHAGTTWRGSKAVEGLVADPSAMRQVSCPALCVRGEDDFVTDKCVAGWSGLPDVRFVTLQDCGHHPLAESTDSYLALLDSFLTVHDDDRPST